MHSDAQQPINEAYKVIDRAPTEGRSTATASTGIGLAYERFWKLPGWFVLAVLWIGGVLLLGSIALVLYLIGWVLLQLVAGFI